jgi:glyoxylase-like metal-dependent hydrolase (beta-lactamase superfamily II)
MVDYDVIVKGNSLSLREGFLALANATLVFTPDGPVLFDVGHYVNRPALINGLARHDLAPADVRAVFLSHLHFDHCNNIDLFPGARVYVSKREWDYAKAPHADDWFVPWLIHEQLQKHEVEFLDGEGRIADGVRYLPTPGHTPGSYALALDTDKHGCVVIAGDAIKYAKELIRGRCDMAFDTVEAGSASIAKIAAMADRIVPGHFPELVREGDKFVWTEAAEFPLLIR